MGVRPTVWEVGRPKMELGQLRTVGFVSIRGMSVITGNGLIVEETAEIHYLPQRIPLVLPSLEALRVHLLTILLSAGAGGPLNTLVIPFRRYWYQESGQSMIETQKKRGRGRFGPNSSRKP